MIQDSGKRQSFETGAVRDIQEGKGRCDLLPLTVVGWYLDWLEKGKRGASDLDERYRILHCLDMYINWNVYPSEELDPGFLDDYWGPTDWIFRALYEFCKMRGWDRYTMILEVAKHFEEGANKYGERNWEKGIPVSRYISSAIRHYLKWCRGDNDEPHDRAFCWNIFCAVWTTDRRDGMDDRPTLEEDEGGEDLWFKVNDYNTYQFSTEDLKKIFGQDSSEPDTWTVTFKIAKEDTEETPKEGYYEGLKVGHSICETPNIIEDPFCDAALRSAILTLLDWIEDSESQGDKAQEFIEREFEFDIDGWRMLIDSRYPKKEDRI